MFAFYILLGKIQFSPLNLISNVKWIINKTKFYNNFTTFSN